MLTHFQYKPLYENKQIPGWGISFYFNKQKMTGIYHPDGKIEWTAQAPNGEDESKLINQIHELMLFHVYDNQR
ncbi:YheE family protein [Bacillus sp. FJAT-29790]|uniref:YheE family protein n=1 Tax=Bacillus sp. FJAT-29790 TaxID=1895002 RepID=UPI001C238471|nr:YheE family protein [Bacillus sp. FJAT-29790]MBU8880038.1 YheE family protein [Bacillus sp. FJAT-29790]